MTAGQVQGQGHDFRTGLWVQDRVATAGLQDRVMLQDRDMTGGQGRAAGQGHDCRTGT